MDFLKFKLLAIAAISAVALGLEGSGQSEQNVDYILCILPFVCIYIDLICYHNNIRVFIIARHLQLSGDEYEIFLSKLSSDTQKKRTKDYYFKLEDFVIHYTSLVIAVLVLLYGTVNYHSDVNFSWGNKLYYFLITGLVGSVIPFISKSMYERRIKALMNQQ